MSWFLKSVLVTDSRADLGSRAERFEKEAPRRGCLDLPPRPFDLQFSSVPSISRVWLFAIPWTTARQASLYITKSQSPLKPMSIESVMSSSHLVLCCPLLLLPPISPSIYIAQIRKKCWDAGSQRPDRSKPRGGFCKALWYCGWSTITAIQTSHRPVHEL